MAPATAFEKAENEQTVISTTLSLLDSVLQSHSTTPLTEPQVDTYLEMSDKCKKDVMDNHRQLQHHAPKTQDMSTFVASFNTMLPQAIQIHAAFHGIKKSFPVTSTTSSSSTTSSAPSSHGGIKLPRLELPKFNGNLQEWVSFRDIFITAVHNSSLTNVEKLTQLKTLVTGEAARQIRSLVLSDANYDIAWKALTERYENNRELLFTIMRRLFSQSQVQPNSAPAMRGLIDTTKECIRSLEILALPTQHWDAVILYILFQKLDNHTRELWEQTLPDTSIPSLHKMFEFLEMRARALAAGAVQQHRPRAETRKVDSHHIQPQTQPTSSKCKLNCNTVHPLFKCPVFRTMTPQQRKKAVETHLLCSNCLVHGHNASSCGNTNTCKICNRKHHTMIHINDTSSQQSSNYESNPMRSVSTNHTMQENDFQTALLATAIVKVIGANRENYPCRAFLDGGSSVSFITEHCANLMNLTLIRNDTELRGLSSTPVGYSKYKTNIVIKPHFPSELTYNITCLVVKKVTNQLPNLRCNTTTWNHIQGLQLADPTFAEPDHVDILLGSDVFWSLLGNEKITGLAGQPHAIKSTLGWLIAGQHSSQRVASTFITTTDLDNNIRRFWEHETIPETPVMTPEEQQCEAHFASTYRRESCGRFVVSIPWKQPRPPLGASRHHAVQRLLSLERRLAHHNGVTDIEKIRKLQHHWKEYKKFMFEYEELGHMSPVPPQEVAVPLHPTYYIPHHFVTKESSTTTKLRVVFDASAATTSGYSLNEAMMTGPQLQDSILDIMLRFRTHPVAYTADLEKMYRQVRVKKEDTDLQRILWRANPNDAIQEYRLNTVTYGTRASSYLAVKVLTCVATDGESKYPEAAAVIKKDFYVDDLLSGSDTTRTAKKIVHDIISLCQTGGFQLRKWTTNDQKLLESIPENLRETENIIPLNHDEDTTSVKTLGVCWNPAADNYQFKLNLPPDTPGSYNKKTILSEIARIFDPVGWLSPVIVVCKIFMQELWKCKVGWSEVLPSHIQDKWLAIKSSLKDLENLHIPRCVLGAKPSRLILCGFSDASEKAYSAVVYVSSFYANQNPSAHLFTSKTRVAPLKVQTLPRLELNGAVLLSQLLKTVLQALNKEVDEVRTFTDSTVVLNWLSAPPSKWKTYVRNRVQTIQENIPMALWQHVTGDSNPADCASRGISAQEILNHPLWWYGNSSMLNPTEFNPISPEVDIDLLNSEARPEKVHHIQPSQLPEFLLKYSSFMKLSRVIAWLQRFITNCKAKKQTSPQQKGTLTVSELNAAHDKIILTLQQQMFSAEIRLIKEGKELPPKSKLLCLHPFLCTKGLLRVGGRIRHARGVPFDRKHPILLPRSHHITNIIILDIHLRNLHAGATATLAAFNQRYWVTQGRDSVRYIIRQCVTCTRFKATTMQQLMGDLPYDRVNPSLPFSKVGVDYAGPFSTRSPGRSKIVFKCWLAIFICFSTRAMHIEVVSSLTTDAFLAALRRFISRRGRPTDIFSDSGSNFLGGKRVLNELFSFFNSSTSSLEITNQCAAEGVQFYTSPGHSPHFGGYWEAGVRSVKHHLRRVIGNALLTYEEMLTLTTQIEAILNSRPLTAASTDPSDLTALTPAHFIVGAPLTSFPDPDLTTINPGRLDRWQLLQQQRQHFWKRWSGEFLTRLQQRPKWCRVNRELAVNDMVLIKDDRLPPLKWKLGRVAAVFPGADGHVRVATIKTSEGELRRPIVKLCHLPITNNE